MTLRKLIGGLAVGAAALASGCHSTSYRQACCPPAVVSSAPVVAAPAAPAPCCNGTPGAVAAPAAPLPPGARPY
jgi:hypothetical protein